MRAIAAFAALVPLLTLPALAERAAVDKCIADADRTIATLKARMSDGEVGAGSSLQDAMQQRARCDKQDNSLAK